jgi:hypothetical protein
MYHELGKAKKKEKLKQILERWDGMDWIDLAHDRGQWRALLKTVINLRVS